jgi:hypothetical protein
MQAGAALVSTTKKETQLWPKHTKLRNTPWRKLIRTLQQVAKVSPSSLPNPKGSNALDQSYPAGWARCEGTLNLVNKPRRWWWRDFVVFTVVVVVVVVVVVLFVVGGGSVDVESVLPSNTTTTTQAMTRKGNTHWNQSSETINQK